MKSEGTTVLLDHRLDATALAVLAQKLVHTAGVAPAVLSDLSDLERLAPALSAAPPRVPKELPGESLRGAGHNTCTIVSGPRLRFGARLSTGGGRVLPRRPA